MHNIEHLNKQVVEHNGHRKHFDRLPEELAESIVEEAQELVQAIQESLLSGDVFSVASEIGDVYILLAQLCDDIGIDPAQAIEMKMTRNERKYPDYTMNNGHSPQEARRLSKDSWKAFGGDVLFSHLYLDILASDI